MNKLKVFIFLYISRFTLLLSYERDSNFLHIWRRLFFLLEHSIKDNFFMQVEDSNPKAKNRPSVGNWFKGWICFIIRGLRVAFKQSVFYFSSQWRSRVYLKQCIHRTSTRTHPRTQVSWHIRFETLQILYGEINSLGYRFVRGFQRVWIPSGLRGLRRTMPFLARSSD